MTNDRVGNDQWWLVVNQHTLHTPPPPGDDLVTEDGELLITEDGQQLVTEGS